MSAPKKYSEEQIKGIKLKIIEELYKGESLKSILETNKDMPSRPIVYQWLNEEHEKYDKEFLNNYARARRDSADINAENIEEIAKKTLDGTYDPASARVAIDAYKWTAGRKQPKKYGDRLDLYSPDGTMTPKADLSSFSTDELIKRAKAAKEIEENLKNNDHDTP